MSVNKSGGNMFGFLFVLVRSSLLIFLIFLSEETHAVEAGARAYVNAPIGLNILQTLYFQSKISGGSFQSTTHAGVLRYFRYVDVFGKAALIGAFLPYATSDFVLPAFNIRNRVTGFADPTLVMGMDFIGAPALTRQEFKHYTQDIIVGGSLQITAPLGRYNPKNRLNLSGNRWVLKPELAVSKKIGDWMLEGLAHYHYFTRNKAYLGNFIREQRGLWGIDTHLSYTIRRGLWVSLDYLHKWGGETRINNIAQGDTLRDTRIGFTASMAFSPAYNAELTVRDDVITRSINQSRSYTLKFQYRW